MKTKRITGSAGGGSLPRMVGLRLSRADMLQVWRDAIVGHQTTLSTRRKKQYDRIVGACDRLLFPRKANAGTELPPPDSDGGSKDKQP